jgi:hypothetical protein
MRLENFCPPACIKKHLSAPPWEVQFITFFCYVFLTSPQMLNSKYEYEQQIYVRYLMTFSVPRQYSVKWYGERWTGKNLEGNGHGLIEVLSWHFPGGTEENQNEIQTEHLSNTSLEHYRLARLLGEWYLYTHFTIQGTVFYMSCILCDGKWTGVEI